LNLQTEKVIMRLNTNLLQSKIKKMLQWTLLTQQNINEQSVKLDNIKAIFTEIWNKFYEVILEISSHKFLINLQSISWNIEKFEIVSTKWFLELSQKSIKTLKNLTEHLLVRLP